jgi:hypothetical protein
MGRHELGPNDWIAVVDDDDFYAREHVFELKMAIRRHPQADVVAQSRYGEQYSDSDVRCIEVAPWRDHTLAPGSIGAHAGLAIRVGAYLDAGGYPLDAGYPSTVPEDVTLLRRIVGDRPERVGYTAKCTYIHSLHLRCHGGRGQRDEPVEHFDWSPKRRWDHDWLESWCREH